jgi:hypothetical protein
MPGPRIARILSDDAEINATARLIYDIGLLKLSKRTGWWLCNEHVTGHQTAGRPGAVAGELRGLVRDYENGGSPEVHCAHDADWLECLFQAIEYRDSGYQNVGGWIETSRARLRTKSAERGTWASVRLRLASIHVCHERRRDLSV